MTISPKLTYSALVDALGVAVVTITTGNTLQQWDVTQVSVELATAPLGATCDLRVNDYLVTPLIATGDVGAGDPPILLLPSDVLKITWRNCTPGQTAKVLVIYNEEPY